MRSEEQFNAYCASDTQCAAISAAVENPSSSTVKGDDGEVITDPEELDKLLEAQKTSYTMDNSWAAKAGRWSSRSSSRWASTGASTWPLCPRGRA